MQHLLFCAAFGLFSLMPVTLLVLMHVLGDEVSERGLFDGAAFLPSHPFIKVLVCSWKTLPSNLGSSIKVDGLGAKMSRSWNSLNRREAERSLLVGPLGPAIVWK